MRKLLLGLTFLLLITSVGYASEKEYSKQNLTDMERYSIIKSVENAIDRSKIKCPGESGIALQHALFYQHSTVLYTTEKSNLPNLLIDSNMEYVDEVSLSGSVRKTKAFISFSQDMKSVTKITVEVINGPLTMVNIGTILKPSFKTEHGKMEPVNIYQCN